jgi:thioredoxin reductase (NADPH)
MIYDLIIVGGGPAGLSAAVYSARYKINVALITKETGGLAATAHKVCNFPSYVSVSGFELMQNFNKQVEELKVPIIYSEINEIKKLDNNFEVITSDKKYKTKKVIIATGTKRKQLNVKGEKEFLGRGVSYCATCDAAFFKDKLVSVIGGSDAALTAALLLSEFAKKVYIIYRKDKFSKAEPSWIELVEKDKKITSLFEQEVKEIFGDKNVEGVLLKSGEKIKCEGVFIEIGSEPDIKFAKELNLKTEKGYIKTDKNQETSVKGIYAAGDITNKELKQIVTASAEGAVAAYNIYKELKKSK